MARSIQEYLEIDMTIDEIYEVIANGIMQSIPRNDWDEVSLSIQGDSTYIETSGTYFISDEEFGLDTHSLDSEVSFAIMELHELTTEGGNNRWNRAIFTLFPDGEFDIEFQWDQDLNDEITSLS